MANDETPVRGQLLTEFSNAMVALHREHFGRGAGAAKSYLIDDIVLCVLTDVYTPVEKTLIGAGKMDHVRNTRQLHQIAMREEFSRKVEQVTGRKVRAFVSSVSFDPDMAFELFLLEPESNAG